MTQRERIATKASKSNIVAVEPALTLSGAYTLTSAQIDKSQIWRIDPGGATRTVTFPAAAQHAGLILFIRNVADAAEDLTLQIAGPTVFGTVSQNESAIVWSDGTSWNANVSPST